MSPSGSVGRADIETGEVDGGNYSSPGRVYADASEYTEMCKHSCLASEIARHLLRRGRGFAPLSNELLRAIAQELEIDADKAIENAGLVPVDAKKDGAQ